MDGPKAPLLISKEAKDEMRKKIVNSVKRTSKVNSSVCVCDTPTYCIIHFENINSGDLLYYKYSIFTARNGICYNFFTEGTE